MFCFFVFGFVVLHFVVLQNFCCCFLLQADIDDRMSLGPLRAAYLRMTEFQNEDDDEVEMADLVCFLLGLLGSGRKKGTMMLIC